MGFNMLLEILRALESFSTEVAFVRLERHVYTDVRRDVISLDGGRATATPLASEIQVVCALATNMAFAYVVLRNLLASPIMLFKVCVQ
jgi:hypothetical protein